jgi:hypothetical protein
MGEAAAGTEDGRYANRNTALMFPIVLTIDVDDFNRHFRFDRRNSVTSYP